MADERPAQCEEPRTGAPRDETLTLKYLPLEWPHSTRLLRLHPSTNHEPLQCSLIEKDLLDKYHKYEALSYVWGNSPANTELDVLGEGNGLYTKVKIRPNLAAALHRVRHPTKSKYLWVDSLCINQDDGVERSQQVSQMGTIFSNASRVLVWLGEDKSSLACSTFASIRMARRWISDRMFEDSRITGLDPETVRLHPSDQDAWIWYQIGSLFHLEWFWRLWCIQELVLAKKAVMLWGNQEIEWLDVSDVTAFLFRGLESGYFERFSMPALGNAYFLRHLREPDSLAPKLSLFRMLSLTRHYEVSDEKDRVYALLGLTSQAGGANSSNVSIPVDYDMPINQLYLEVAKQIVDEDENLLVLSCVQNNYGDGHIVKPSWVPTWHEFSTKILTPFDDIARAQLPQDRELSSTRVIDNSIFCDGTILDEVVGESITFTNDEVLHNAPETFRVAFEQIKDFSIQAKDLKAAAIVERISKVDPVPDKEVRTCQVFYQCLHGFLPDHKFGSDGFPIEWQSFFQWVTWFPGIPFDRLPESFRNEIQHDLKDPPKACINRRLYATKKGFLGLGSMAVRTGDKVCLLPDAGSLMILRPEDDHWLLVGETHVHPGRTGWRVPKNQSEPSNSREKRERLQTQLQFQTQDRLTDQSDGNQEPSHYPQHKVTIEKPNPQKDNATLDRRLTPSTVRRVRPNALAQLQFRRRTMKSSHHTEFMGIVYSWSHHRFWKIENDLSTWAEEDFGMPKQRFEIR